MTAIDLRRYYVSRMGITLPKPPSDGGAPPAAPAVPQMPA